MRDDLPTFGTVEFFIEREHAKIGAIIRRRLGRIQSMLINGTTYHETTPQAVIQILEDNRLRGSAADRLLLDYGDRETGRAWGDTEAGRIGRSRGPTKIPLIIHNRRSAGGPGLLEHCIVRIRLARGKTVLYCHPQYHEGAE